MYVCERNQTTAVLVNFSASQRHKKATDSCIKAGEKKNNPIKRMKCVRAIVQQILDENAATFPISHLMLLERFHSICRNMISLRIFISSNELKSLDFFPPTIFSFKYLTSFLYKSAKPTQN